MDAKQLLERYKPTQKQVLETDRHMLSVRYSPDGKLLAAGGADGSIRRWDLSGDEPVELPSIAELGAWVQQIVFSTDSKALYAADSWGLLRAWKLDGEQAELLWKVEAHDGWIQDLAISPDGTQLATGAIDRAVRIWNSADGSRTHDLSGHEHDVLALTFHPDGKSLVSGDLLGVVKHWSLPDGKHQRDIDASVLFLMHRLQDVGGVRRLAFDAAGKQLGCAGTTPKNGANVQGTPTILLFDWAEGKLLHTLNVGGTSDGFVYDLALHPDGFVMAVTSGNPGTGKFFLFQPGEEKPFFLETKMANCHGLAVHPNGTHLAVAATGKGRGGNGRSLNKDGQYEGNSSPIHLWDIGLQPAQA